MRGQPREKNVTRSEGPTPPIVRRVGKKRTEGCALRLAVWGQPMGQDISVYWRDRVEAILAWIEEKNC